MKSDSSCFPCFLEQLNKTILFAIEDEDERWAAYTQAASVLADLDKEKPPAYNVSLILHKVAQVAGRPDLYADMKREANEKVMAALPSLLGRIKSAENKLEAAFRLALAGSCLDMGVRDNDELEAALEKAFGDGVTRFDFSDLEAALAGAGRILYILDNAGEMVLDRVLLEGLKAHGKMVLAAVKSGPVAMDATMEDAKQVGLEKVGRVIETGTNFAGVVPGVGEGMFQKALESADLVIAKGQASYEALEGRGERFFFMFNVKCDHLGEKLDSKKGDLVLIKG